MSTALMCVPLRVLVALHEHLAELDTRLVMRLLCNTERVLKNAAVEYLLKKEKALGSKIGFEDILRRWRGAFPKIMKDGQMDAGA